MEEIFMLRRRQRGGFMAHRPDCHELEDVVKTELQARPWCRKPPTYGTSRWPSSVTELESCEATERPAHAQVSGTRAVRHLVH